jgi:cytochrome c oxidase subunit 3
MSEMVAEHFEGLEQQAHASRLGMWVFLGSEVLFFSGLFALYTAYRIEYPHGFGEGVAHNTLAFGSVNTAVLLVSSYTIATAVHTLRSGRQKACAWLTGVTILLGAGFLAIKMCEYAKHFSDGIFPGGVGASYHGDLGDPGTKMFFTLYFCMTGLHALHVFVGLIVLTFLLVKVTRRQLDASFEHPLAIGAVYWHLVDLFWVFLWPLFYLVPGDVR